MGELSKLRLLFKLVHFRDKSLLGTSNIKKTKTKKHTKKTQFYSTNTHLFGLTHTHTRRQREKERKKKKKRRGEREG